MMKINEIIDWALRNAETYTREENEGYREVYISYEDVEKLAYEAAKQAIFEYEDRLADKMPDVDIDTLMDETRKELGL